MSRVSMCPLAWALAKNRSLVASLERAIQAADTLPFYFVVECNID